MIRFDRRNDFVLWDFDFAEANDFAVLIGTRLCTKSPISNLLNCTITFILAPG